MKEELKEIIKNCKENMKTHEWFLINDNYELPINYYINMGKKEICEYLLDKLEESQEHKIPEKLNPEKMSIYEMSLKINEIIDYLEINNE